MKWWWWWWWWRALKNTLVQILPLVFRRFEIWGLWRSWSVWFHHGDQSIIRDLHHGAACHTSCDCHSLLRFEPVTRVSIFILVPHVYFPWCFCSFFLSLYFENTHLMTFLISVHTRKLADETSACGRSFGRCRDHSYITWSQENTVSSGGVYMKQNKPKKAQWISSSCS